MPDPEGGLIRLGAEFHKVHAASLAAPDDTHEWEIHLDRRWEISDRLEGMTPTTRLGCAAKLKVALVLMLEDLHGSRHEDLVLSVFGAFITNGAAMKAPVSRRRGKRPTLSPVTMDLLGMGADGNLYLWSEAAQARPMDHLPLHGPGRIKSGHYVIARGTKVVTVYLGNATKPGDLVVQHMCSDLQFVLTITVVEPMLLGQVVPDPKQAAEISAALQRLLADQVARQTTPYRKGGTA